MTSVRTAAAAAVELVQRKLVTFDNIVETAVVNVDTRQRAKNAGMHLAELALESMSKDEDDAVVAFENVRLTVKYASVYTNASASDDASGDDDSVSSARMRRHLQETMQQRRLGISSTNGTSR